MMGKRQGNEEGKRAGRRRGNGGAMQDHQQCGVTWASTSKFYVPVSSLSAAPLVRQVTATSQIVQPV